MASARLWRRLDHLLVLWQSGFSFYKPLLAAGWLASQAGEADQRLPLGLTFTSTDTTSTTATETANSITGSLSSSSNESHTTSLSQSGTNSGGTYTLTATTSESPVTINESGNSIIGGYTFTQTATQGYSFNETDAASSQSYTMGESGSAIRGPRILCCTFGLLSFAFCLSSSAATKRKSEPAQLQKVLAAEAKGGAFARDQQLAGLIESAPNYAPARWAAGYLDSDGRWLRFDVWPATDTDTNQLTEYRHLRVVLPGRCQTDFGPSEVLHLFGSACCTLWSQAVQARAARVRKRLASSSLMNSSLRGSSFKGRCKIHESAAA